MSTVTDQVGGGGRDPSDGVVAPRFVGQRIARTEDLRLLTGRGRFVDDMNLPGTLHAAFVRSPLARGRILSIDIASARALRGVHAVYVCADLQPVLKDARPAFWPPNISCPPFVPLARADVRFAGEAVALVIADDRYIAEDAAELVQVEYEAEDPVIDYLAAEGAPVVHPELGTNLVFSGASAADPELEAAFAGAAHVVEETVHQQNQLALPMETRGILVSFEAEEVRVWTATQSPQTAAMVIADALGLPHTHVRAYAYDVGGGFGMKAHPVRDEFAVVAAAKLLRRPVKWIEDRGEHLIASSHARCESARMRMAFDAEYRILAASMDYRSNSGAYGWWPGSGAKITETFPGPYRIPRYGYRHSAVYTNTCGRGAYRGPWMFETVAREIFLDIAARRLGMDPLELRRRNIILPADQPYRAATGIVFDRVSPDQTLEEVAKKVDVAAFRREQAAARAQGRYLGLGIAAYMEPTAPPNAFLAHHNIELRMEPSGHVVVRSPTHASGQGTETTIAQVVADELGLPFESVRVLQGDSAEGGFGFGGAGSRQAVMAGGAAVLSARKLRAKILAIAAHLLEAAEADLRIRDGRISVAGVPDLSVTMQQVAQLAYFVPAKLPPGMEPGLSAEARHLTPGITWANAAHACVVEVDVATGMVKILRWIASEDCGVMINPMVVDGQISGGIAQAIGGVLLEEAPYDERGNPLAATLKDYLPPLAPQMPVIEFSHLCTPSAGPGGFKGVGEGGAIIGPPTLANAIVDALAPFGIECTRLPLSPDRLVGLIEAGRLGVTRSATPVSPLPA